MGPIIDAVVIGNELWMTDGWGFRVVPIREIDLERLRVLLLDDEEDPTE